MTLLHRNPQAVVRIKQKVADLVDNKFTAILTDNIERRPDNNFHAYGEFRSMTTTNVQEITLRTIHSVMDSEHVGEVLNRMVWGAITIEYQQFPMLTSDRPLIMTNGLADPRSHILLPISPNCVFVAASTQETMDQIVQRANDRTRFVRTINDLTARQARKYVYGPDDCQLRFVENRRGQQIRSTALE